MFIPYIGSSVMTLIRGDVAITNPADIDPNYGTELSFSQGYADSEPVFSASIRGAGPTAFYGYAFDGISEHIVNGSLLSPDFATDEFTFITGAYLNGAFFAVSSDYLNTNPLIDMRVASWTLASDTINATVPNPSDPSYNTSSTAQVFRNPVTPTGFVQQGDSAGNVVHFIVTISPATIKQGFSIPSSSFVLMTFMEGGAYGVIVQNSPTSFSKIVFNPTVVGAAFDATETLFEFANATVASAFSNNSGNSFILDSDFYVSVTYDDIGPIDPFLIKMSLDLSGYELILANAGDAESAALITAFKNGDYNDLYFAASQTTGAILMTGGPVGPNPYYAVLTADAPIAARYVPRYIGLKLPCIAGCIPLFDKRKYK